MLKFLKGFLCLNLFISLPIQAMPNSTEDSICNYIDQSSTQSIALLKLLVNINSGTMNFQGVHQVGEIFKNQFKQLGFKTWWDNSRTLNRAGNLIAEHHGNSKTSILLIGHLDTVFPRDSSFQNFKLNNNKALGPGVIDDKGGDVVILSALQALQKANALKNTNITVVLMGDEENTGKPSIESRQKLRELAKNADVAIDFEWGINLNTATVARRGIAHWTLTTHGKEAHSSQIFTDKVGDGAVFELARVLNLIRENLKNFKGVTFNPGITLGGTDLKYSTQDFTGNVSGESNVVAQLAIAEGDMRFLNNDQQSQAEKMMLSVAKSSLNHTDSKLEFMHIMPAMAETKNNLELLKSFSQVSQDLGYGKMTALDPLQRGGADINYVADIVPANLSGLGPLGKGDHSRHETLAVDSLAIAAKRAAILIYRLSQ